MRFTHEYFREEVHRFREACGDARSTPTQLEAARRALCFVFMNTDGDAEKLALEWEIADQNYLRRLPYIEQAHARREKDE